MLSLKAAFKRTKEAQALLELTIWGALMLMVSSMIVSYIMYFIYQQDLMIRNFRSAVKFAAGKGRTGGMVYQVMVEHRRIPAIGPSFIPGYREIQNVVGVIWSWNIMWKESKQDPDQAATIVRYIVDGKNVSKQIPKNPNANNLLPDSLKNKDRDFLVIDASPDEYILSKKDGVLNLLDGYVRYHYPDTYNMVTDLFDEFDISSGEGADNKSYLEMSDEERADYLNKIQDAIDNLEMIKSDIEDEKDDAAAPSIWEGREKSVNDAISKLSGLHDYLANEKWRGDVESVGDLLGKKTLVQDQRVETIQVGPSQKKVDITGNYTVIHESEITSGNVEITWQADNESIEEN